jgi:hypothetical protein
MISRRCFLCGLALGTLIAPLAAEAQQAGKVPRVGVILGGTRAARQSQLDALRQGMRDRGYIEGHNIVFEIRAPEKEGDAPFAEFAAERHDVTIHAASHRFRCRRPHGGDDGLRSRRSAATSTNGFCCHRCAFDASTAKLTAQDPTGRSTLNTRMEPAGHLKVIAIEAREGGQ